MIRKDLIRLTILCVCISLTTLAQAGSKDGFYAGLGIGETFDAFKLTTQSPVTGFTIVSPTENKDTFLGTVFLGYGGTANTGYYLGAELGTYFPSRKGMVDNRPGVTLGTFFTDVMQISDYATADLLPGYRINPKWLVHGRLGASYANAKFHQLATASSPDTYNQEKKFGGRIGAGVDYSYSNHLSVGVDYFYTQYQSMASVSAHPFNTRFNQKVNSNYIGISLAYTFAAEYVK